MKHTQIQKRIIRGKLPPILEIDEDGVPTFELDTLGKRWSSDADDAPGVQLGDWPMDLDD